MNRIYSGKYYFYIEYYTYIKKNDESVLILNTLDNQKIVSNDVRILTLVESMLCKKDNVLEIDFDNIYHDEFYQSFFEDIRNIFMGDLIEVNLSNGAPVNFYPIAKIEDNFRKKDNHALLGHDTLCNSLFNLNIFLNAACTQHCANCANYYKQFHCCSKFLTENDSLSIDPIVIEKIFKYSKFENLNKINILGGNIALYKDIDRILPYLSDYKEKCFAVFKYNNIDSINAEILSFFDNRIVIIVDAAEIDAHDVDRLISDYHQFEIHIVATDELQLKKMMPLFSASISYRLVPFYNGNNLAFFENNVFLCEEDIFEANYTIKKIHKNQLINNGFFGNLTVLPDGNVFIDMNGSFLGNLQSESILNIISKALKNEDSLWFKTRKTTTCSDCLFVDLCPPVSSYELAIGKYNLCNVN